MLPCSVTLLSLLSLLLVFILHIPPASGAIFELFENPESYPNATSFCVACYGSSHPSKGKFAEIRPCAELRSIFRAARKLAKDKKRKVKKHQKLKEAERTKEQVFKNFAQKCEKGETDCFMTYSIDKRKLGFESMGCGAGPPEVPAEPKEPCQTGYIRFEGKNEEMETCVCANKPANAKAKKSKKDYDLPYAFCNFELARKQGASISIGSPMLLTMMAVCGIFLRAVLTLT